MGLEQNGEKALQNNLNYCQLQNSISFSLSRENMRTVKICDFLLYFIFCVFPLTCTPICLHIEIALLCLCMHLKLCTKDLCILMRGAEQCVKKCKLCKTFLTLVGKRRYCKGYSLFLSSTALIIKFN